MHQHFGTVLVYMGELQNESACAAGYPANKMVRKPGRVVTMLPLQVAILACMAASTAALGFVPDGRKCKCFMCVCDFDPHPLPPEQPSHHHPPPAEPEHHSPPPPEHVLSPPTLPEPEHYYPPPSYGYYPPAVLPFYPPAGDMYPRDRASSKSGAHRQRVPSRLLLAAVVALASAVQ